MDKSEDSKLFSGGFEVAFFVTSSGLLRRSWNVITSSLAGINYNIGVGLSWKVYKEQNTNVTIIAFENTLPNSSNLQSDFVSSSELRDRNLDHFEFLSSETNPFFSLNKTAVSLFFDNHQRLNELKSEINSSPDLFIITGLALGGSIASLFTLSLLDSFDSKKKRPLCITFGSPLIGNKELQETISHGSTWNSCFLHVVTYKDTLPRRFIIDFFYMPFGTFLLCSESNTYCTSFENPESILALFKASIHDENQVFQSIDYGYIVKSLSDRAIFKDSVAQIGGINHPDSLPASISLQLQALGWTSPHMQQHIIDVNNLEILEKEFIQCKKKAMDLSKKLSNADNYNVEYVGGTYNLHVSNRFSGGFEVAPFVTSSGLLQGSWDVITSSHVGITSNVGVGLSWKVYQEQNITIIAFEATLPNSSNLQADLVSSSELRDRNLDHFEFLSSEKNPIFFLNNTAVSLFFDNNLRLNHLKSEICSTPLIVVTGHGLGGAVASLFTIYLLDSIGSTENRALCITFGSPLVGDKKLQQAISCNSIWNSCFLHVVSHKDPLPKLFISNATSSYTPFGTILLCSDESSTCFENPESVLKVLNAFGANHVQNQGFQSTEYGNIVEDLNLKAFCTDFATPVEDKTHSDLLKTGISLQLQALGFTDSQTSSISMQLEALALTPQLQQQGRNIDPSKKLNEVKGDMAQLEWYKKQTKKQQIGYYDSYKNMKSKFDHDVVVFHKRLTKYWDKWLKKWN